MGVPASPPSLSSLFKQDEKETASLIPNNIRKSEQNIAAPNSDTVVSCCSAKSIISAVLGSSVFLLYQVVFCLAQAATIAVANPAYLALGTQMAALGVLFSGPVQILGTRDIPAVYPATDLFLAPFLATLIKDTDGTTFAALVSTGLVLSALLCAAAARFRWAAIGDFLPYPVLAGFFSAIGVLLYSLGFSVDTGVTLGYGLTHVTVWKRCLLHHVPSLVVGVSMYITSRRHSLSVIFWVLATIVSAYAVLHFTGTSLTQAQEESWFYSVGDLQTDTILLPFSLWWNLSEVSWKDYVAGLPTILALAFLYLLRCSLHAAALKKNASSFAYSNNGVSSTVEIDALLENGYAYSQLMAFIVGGIAVAPSVAASQTMVQLGAAGIFPQIGSCVLLFPFFVTNFYFVQYIPKPAFSCLMVVAGIDITRTWLFDSYFKTKDKLEWIVGPLLVILSFAYGLLIAIFIGVAASAVLFVSKVYHTGIVRFVGNGLTVHSTVERGMQETSWLDLHGDLIQILVLQNYLFFGNCKSVLRYVVTMFSDDSCSSGSLQDPLPVPRFLIIDVSMVTGMDTSSVDLFREIQRLCENNDCTLWLVGMSRDSKEVLHYANLRPRYSSNLDNALGKSEDALLSSLYHLKEKVALETSSRDNATSPEGGFLYALQKIDELHHLDIRQDLSSLWDFVDPIFLEKGDVLDPHSQDTSAAGLYFIESGMLDIRPSPHRTSIGATSCIAPLSLRELATSSIGHLNARRLSVEQRNQPKDQSQRTAHIGQGWVIGSTETASNTFVRSGVYIVVAKCRLHYLSKSKLQRIEDQFPRLALTLYKLLAHLSTARQLKTIQQLDQLFRILSTPAPRLRGGKNKLASLQNRSGFAGS